MVNAVSYLMTYPMVPFMVMHFFPELAGGTRIGFYSGLLEGSFHTGSFIGAFAWSGIADKYGR